MTRKPCQCGSNCHAACGSIRCCDCGAPMVGPVELELWERPDDSVGWANHASKHDAWVLLQAAARSLEFWDLKHAWRNKAMEDVLSEAIEAAGALGL